MTLAAPTFTQPISTFEPDLISLLVAMGYHGYGKDIFKGKRAVIPADVELAVTIVPTPGQGDEGTHNLSRDNIAYERPAALLVFSSENATTAQNAAKAAHFELNFVDTLINGTWWRVCSPKNEPEDIGLDGTGRRARYAFNLEAVKRLSPATS